jgi:hypothetical protein
VSHARARLAVALAGRRLLAPLTLLVFAVLGVYAYRENGVQASFAVTAVLGALFCAWLVVATEREVAGSPDAILTVAAGGPARAWRGRLALVALFTLAVTVVFLVWPTATGAFDRAPGIADLGLALLAHAACGALGGCLGLLLAPPVRIATAFAATLAVVLASIALAGSLGVAAGPGAVAQALSDAPDDRISLAVIAACAVTLGQAAALALAGRRLQRWRG